MDIIFGIIIGFLLSISFNLIRKRNKVEVEVKKEPIKTQDKPIGLGRGIYIKSWTLTTQTGDKASFYAKYEVRELARTNTKSKVEVISVITNRSKSNVPSELKQVHDMIHNSWIDTSEIEWIKDISDTRNEKIDQILKNN